MAVYIRPDSTAIDDVVFTAPAIMNPSRYMPGTVSPCRRLLAPVLEQFPVPQTNIATLVEETTKTILIVDNEPTMRENLEYMLPLELSLPMDIYTAGSIEEARTLLGEEGITPDIIISDYRLIWEDKSAPTGADFLKEMADTYPNSFRILMTAKERPDSTAHHVFVHKEKSFMREIQKAVRAGYRFRP